MLLAHVVCGQVAQQAQGGEDDHCRGHVPGCVLRPGARILLEEHEPVELDARVQEHAGGGGGQPTRSQASYDVGYVLTADISLCLLRCPKIE